MPRAYDRLVPPTDKDPNRFGTDYSDPLSAVSDAAAVAGEQIRDQLVQIIMDKTGIDLTGPIEFIDWLSNQIGVNLQDLATLLSNLAAGILNALDGFIKELERITGLNFSHGPVEFLLSLFAAFSKDTGLNFGNGPVAFLASIFAALSKATGLDFANGPLAFINSIFVALSTATGLNFANGPVAFLASILAAFAKATGLDFANGPAAFLASIFTALSTATGLNFANGPAAFLASILAAFAKATGLDFANGPAAFLASLATQVTTTASNLIKPLTDLVQSLIDGIAGIWAGVAVVGKPLQDALTAIAGILGIGQGAAAVAAQANMGVSAILAQQAGGFSDEFDYTLANNLPAAWQKKTPLADSYGPDGSGIARGVMSGTSTGPVQYVQTTKPLTAADMKVTGVLARVPWWDLLVKSGWYLLVQANPTDRTAYGVDIQNTACQFFSLNAAGVQTNIGTAKTIPANAAGLPYTLEIKGTTLTLYRNHIVAATQAVSAALPGRCVGFGGFKPVYTNLTDNPLAQFAGIAWQPA